MKYVFNAFLKAIFFVTVFASLSFAATEYVGCKDLDAPEYNALLVLEDGRLVATSMITSDFKELVAVPAGTQAVFLTYNTEAPRHLSYIIRNTNQMTEVIEIRAVISGDTADTYFGEPSGVPMTCHLLQSAPMNSILSSGNFKKVISLKDTF